MVGENEGGDLVSSPKLTPLALDLLPSSSDALERPSSPSRRNVEDSTHLNSVENTGVEEVDTSVDSVPDELDGLLDEPVDDGRVGFLNDDSVG